MYGVVDAEDIGVEVVRLRAAAVIVEIVFVLFPAPNPLDADILAIQEVAVDSRKRRVVS